MWVSKERMQLSSIIAIEMENQQEYLLVRIIGFFSIEMKKKDGLVGKGRGEERRGVERRGLENDYSLIYYSL